ncbi:MAG: hotdog family protein [Candidatus Xenobia bacterium]
MQQGDVITFERTFTDEDLDLFTRVSQDAGIHHLQPDPQGRRMVQGLLTATLPTRVGGQLNYLARHMDFNFVRPVFVGDTIRCAVTLQRYEPAADRIDVEARFECTNQHGKVVLTGATQGIIRR